ncbi:hypothetical protein CEUSTIGMA_g8759.t1 [Chlamydomonas eustigma]|uniref:EF-hand domain-containing protein n=1 Tax=Chlamydomonas eustigma TaxID=1157962 RepID=A0A250XE22_9CHLO|nr:hypothetical protein CEUSTIGMA_g8759.t1 [Chlamydomonas eustigma]|eukprot:GAX81328.1 hypothetical protein CEUSTIGMA_g8759.t1 [Chlamydomonas eustigma]
MSETVSKKVEEYVRSSTFFIRLCEKIYDKKLGKDGKGLVPILKVTMAMPVMFQKFQTKLFDKIGVKIGCPTYRETVKILMMHDKNKDRMISREEFEGVAISMLYIAAANFFQSFMEVYMTSILLGIILTQAVTLTLVVNCAVTVQWLLGLVPTFGGLFIPSLLLQVPALVFGSALGAVIRLRILKHLVESSVEEEEEDQSLKDDKDKDEPPKLKMKDLLKGFTEIRKGIFNE